MTSIGFRAGPRRARGAPARCFGLALALLAGAAAAQPVYKSIGADGRVTYSDHPPAGARVEKTLSTAAQPASVLSDKSPSYVEQLKRLRAAAPTPAAAAAGAGTVFYGAAWCSYCTRAKAFLASRNVSYREVDIDTPEGLESFANAGGGKGIPLLIHGERRLQGFSPASYEALFPGTR
jgi:glutaredoxin